MTRIRLHLLSRRRELSTYHLGHYARERQDEAWDTLKMICRSSAGHSDGTTRVRDAALAKTANARAHVDVSRAGPILTPQYCESVTTSSVCRGTPVCSGAADGRCRCHTAWRGSGNSREIVSEAPAFPPPFLEISRFHLATHIAVLLSRSSLYRNPTAATGRHFCSWYIMTPFARLKAHIYARLL